MSGQRRSDFRPVLLTVRHQMQQRLPRIDLDRPIVPNGMNNILKLVFTLRFEPSLEERSLAIEILTDHGQIGFILGQVEFTLFR